MKKIFTLPLKFEFEQIKITVFPTVIVDNDEVILVDCGYPYFRDKIEEAMNKEGLSIGDITKIIITHCDHDHMGSLKTILDENPNIEVMASKEQAKYITGKEKSLRLIEAEKNQLLLDEKGKIENQKFINMIASVEKIEKVSELNNNYVIPVYGGIKVIDTSGHMPGHISLYVEEEKTLITGDALDVSEEDNKLGISMPQFMMNMGDAIESVKKFLNYDIEKIICYHGGVYTKDIEESIKSFLKIK